MNSHTTHPNIQSAFLEQVRKTLPDNISFADELAEILSVSKDSAYRRIRGETVLSLDEVKRLCDHYRVSLDTLLSPSSEIISFHKRSISAHGFTLEKWMQSVLGNLDMIAGLPQREVIYCAKDIPFFHYFKFPELAAFKLFFWMKSYHRYPQYANSHYDRIIISKELIETGRRMWNRYAEIPIVEIWSDETFNVTLRQIQFYLDNGFISNQQASQLIEEYRNMLRSVRQEAAQGFKGENGATFTLYQNEILIAETTILFKMGEKRVAFVTYNTMNILTTSQENFCHEIEEYMNNIFNKSLLVSSTGEKVRNKFFNRMEQVLDKTKLNLSILDN